jgi:hypothetical protein
LGEGWGEGKLMSHSHSISEFGIAEWVVPKRKILPPKSPSPTLCINPLTPSYLSI